MPRTGNSPPAERPRVGTRSLTYQAPLSPQAGTQNLGDSILPSRPPLAEHLETSAPLPCRGLGGAQAADPGVGRGAAQAWPWSATGVLSRVALEGQGALGIKGSAGSLCVSWGLGSAGGLAKFEKPEMASPERPKLCRGLPTKPVARCLPESPLPSLHPAFRAQLGLRGAVKYRSWKKMPTFQRCSVRWTHVPTGGRER